MCVRIGDCAAVGICSQDAQCVHAGESLVTTAIALCNQCVRGESFAFKRIMCAVGNGVV